MQTDWTTTIWGIILLGLAGAALFEFVVKRILASAGTRGSAFFKQVTSRSTDRAFRDAARIGPNVALMRVVTLPAIFIAAGFVAVTFVILLSPVIRVAPILTTPIEGSPVPVDGRMLLTALIVVGVGFLVAAILNRVFRAIFVVGLSASFSRTLDYLRPHIEAEDEFLLRQMYVCMSGRADAKAINEKMLELAARAQVRIPWEDEMHW